MDMNLETEPTLAHFKSAEELLEEAGRDGSAICIWVFGYGSLVHTAGYPFLEKVEKVYGYIKGWKRVWWQSSTDHRGIPEAPGRVVTLVQDDTAATWGAAYRLAGTYEELRTALAYLEWREKQYDHRARVDVYTSTSTSNEPAVRNALCYIATECSINNPNWSGPGPLDEIADIIARSKGPSGPNWEYLSKLANAMREINAADEELFLLERKVIDRLQHNVDAELQSPTE